MLDGILKIITWIVLAALVVAVIAAAIAIFSLIGDGIEYVTEYASVTWEKHPGAVRATPPKIMGWTLLAWFTHSGGSNPEYRATMVKVYSIGATIVVLLLAWAAYKWLRDVSS